MINKFQARIHLATALAGVVADQVTKLWAVARFAEPNGNPKPEFMPIIGNFLRFQLDYNEGAAFSMRPQEILPFLHPTLFFSVLTLVALSGLLWFYKSLEAHEDYARTGVALIISGAIGNLIDRMRIHKVIDFISVDFPDVIMHRWPTFNIADSLVLTGVALVILSPTLLKLRKTK